MRTPTVSDLFSRGFSSVHCPVTREVMPNMTRNSKGFHISYAGYQSHYDSDTTALVLQGRVFFILNGNHAGAMVEAVEQSGIDGCVALFIEKIQLTNPHSEHRMAVRVAADPFALYPTTLEVIGQNNVDRIVQALVGGHV